ncbi:hypothetical protein [Pseudolactococcus yaeyamensis]
MAEKKGFLKKKTASKTLDKGAKDTVQQMNESDLQVIALKQKLRVIEQQKEDIKLQYETLKYGNSGASDALLDKQKDQFEKTLNEYRTSSEQRILLLEQEVATKNARLRAVEVDLQSEKNQVANLSQELETSLASKAAEITRLTKEKLEIKSQVSEALLELQEHFDYKTTLLETERESLALEKEKQKQEALRIQKLEEREAGTQKMQDEAVHMIESAKANAKQIINRAQAEVAEKEAQSKQELSRLKARMEYYSAQINEAVRTIEALLGNVEQL